MIDMTKTAFLMLLHLEQTFHSYRILVFVLNRKSPHTIISNGDELIGSVGNKILTQRPLSSSVENNPILQRFYSETQLKNTRILKKNAEFENVNIETDYQTSTSLQIVNRFTCQKQI